MKLASYKFIEDGRKSFGLIIDSGIIDIGCRPENPFKDIATFLNGGARTGPASDASLQARLAVYANNSPSHDFSVVEFLPVVEVPGKIFCVGMNYEEKRKEFDETIDAPTLFIRFADSLVGNQCPVIKPEKTNEFDYEGELAVIIGRRAYAVSREDALSYVAGYSCFMDGSVRDMQYAWFTAGKNWPQTGAFGPWLTTSEEIPDPNKLQIRTYLNGEMVQNDNTANMVRSVAELIEYISAFSPLFPGDVIITGSPGGVGKKRTPPIFLKDGDLIEVEIDVIGRLTNKVIAEELIGK